MKKIPSQKALLKKSPPESKNTSAISTNASSVKIPFVIENLSRQMETTFDLWTIKKPSVKIQIKRSTIFILALLATIFWPINNLIIETILLVLAWILLSLTATPAPRVLLMLNLMLNIAFLFYLMRVFIPIY